MILLSFVAGFELLLVHIEPVWSGPVPVDHVAEIQAAHRNTKASERS